MPSHAVLALQQARAFDEQARAVLSPWFELCPPAVPRIVSAAMVAEAAEDDDRLRVLADLAWSEPGRMHAMVCLVRRARALAAEADAITMLQDALALIAPEFARLTPNAVRRAVDYRSDSRRVTELILAARAFGASRKRENAVRNVQKRVAKAVKGPPPEPGLQARLRVAELMRRQGHRHDVGIIAGGAVAVGAAGDQRALGRLYDCAMVWTERREMAVGYVKKQLECWSALAGAAARKVAMDELRAVLVALDPAFADVKRGEIARALDLGVTNGPGTALAALVIPRGALGFPRARARSVTNTLQATTPRI